MYRKNRVLKKMIQEHMSIKSQSPPEKYKPQRYYQHSSMEFNQEKINIKPNEFLKNPSRVVNGNTQSMRSSAGNLNTYYSSQTPFSGSNRETSTSKLNYTSTPFSNQKSIKGGKAVQSNKLNTKEVFDEPIANESFNDTYMDDS